MCYFITNIASYVYLIYLVVKISRESVLTKYKKCHADLQCDFI